MDGFRKQLIQISIDGDQTLKTLTEALYQTISAGITAPVTAIALVKEADIAATAGLAKTGQAVKAFTTVLNAWGQRAGTVQEINDLLFMTLKRGVTTFPELSKSLGNVATIASQAGVSTQETMAAFTTLTKSGLDSRTAMTYLKNTISALIKPSRGSAEIFKKLGIEIGENAIRQKGLIGIMEQVKEKTGGNSEVMAKLFGNIRSLQGAMTLAGDGFKVFAEDLKYMKNAAGSADAAFERMANTWKFQSDQFKNIISVLMIKTFDPFFDGMKEHFKNLNFWLKQSGKGFSSFGTIVGDSLKGVTNFVTGFLSVWDQVVKIVKMATKEKSPLIEFTIQSIKAQLAYLKLPFKLIAEEGEETSHRLNIARKLADAQAKQERATLSKLTSEYKNNAAAREKINKAILAGQSKLLPGQDPAGQLKLMIEAKRAAEALEKLPGGDKKKKTAFDFSKEKGTGRQTTGELTESFRIFMEGRKRMDAAMRHEGDAYQQLEEKRTQYVERYGFSTHLMERIDRWYQMEKAKIRAKEEAEELKDIEKTEKRRQRWMAQYATAKTRIDAVTAKAKRHGSTFIDIVFGTDEELQQRFGKKLSILGSNVRTFREGIAAMQSSDLIANAAVWWAKFTNTGKAGAEGFVTQVKSTMSTFVTGLTDMWSSFWQRMVTGPEDASKEIVPMLLDLIGNMAAGWAAYFAAMVPGLIATYQYPQAAAAAAAALALGAVSGIAKGGAAALRTANEKTSSAAGGGVSKANDAFKASQNKENTQPTTINMYMGFVAPPTQRQAEQLAGVVGNALSKSKNTLPADIRVK